MHLLGRRQGLALGGGFLPTSLPNLELWLAARFIPGLAATDIISTWPDRSGKGRDAVAAAGVEPTFQVNIRGGKPAARFDGVDNVMTLSTALALPSQLTVAIAYANRTGTNGTLWSTGIGIGTAPIQRDTAYWVNAGEVNIAGPAAGLNAYNLGVWVFDYDTDIYNFYRHGVVDGTLSAARTNPGGNFLIGARNGTSEYLNGDILEMVVYSSALSTGARHRIERYLARQYALATA